MLKIYYDLVKSSTKKNDIYKILLFSPSFHIVILFRLSSFLYRKIPFIGNLLGLIIEYLNRVIYAVDISRKATIDEGFVIQHGQGLVIGSEVIIGKNCRVFNGVNIGNKYVGIGENNQPKIGNNVIIGSGAKCLGSITIGDNVTIGTNSVVITDIASNSTCVGNPSRVLDK
jgi:serine O-acetyltransferase